MRSPFGLTLLPNQYPALHGLRVIGILSVIQIHLSFELGMRRMLGGPLHAFSQKIWFGMDLFFVLSGFLIGNILLGAEEGELGTRKVLRFYARRSFRIIPLYFVVLTVLALLKRLDPIQRAQLPREFLYLTNYSDVSHVVMFWGWSLCVEEHFYLAVPFLVIILRKLQSHRSRIALLVLLFFSALGVRFLVVYARAVPLDTVSYFRQVYIATHTRYDTLIAGILLAYLHRNFGDRIARALDDRSIRWTVVGVASLLTAFLLFPPSFAMSVAGSLVALGTITSVIHVLVLALSLNRSGWLIRILSAKLFLRFATLGYGVYLVHMPLVLAVGIKAYRMCLLQLGSSVPIAFVLAVGAVFGVALIISYVLHLLVEKPALWLRDVAMKARS